MGNSASRCPSRSRYEAMVRAEAEAMGIDPEMVLSRRRQRPYALCRFRVFAKLRADGQYSLPGIGRTAGLDHTSVLHGLRRLPEIERLYAIDVAYRLEREACKAAEAKLPPRPRKKRKPLVATTPIFIPAEEVSKWRAA